jgi:hypothetical protein
MDRQLRAAERILQETPILSNLAYYLSIRLRTSVTPDDYDELVEIMQSVPPFDRDNWPWYISYEDRYNEAKHLDILRMIVRMYPAQSILDHLSSVHTAKDLCGLMSVVRRHLAEGQTDLIPLDDYTHDEYGPDYEDLVSHVLNHGLYQFPEALVVEPEEGSSLMCSVVTLVDRFDPPAGTRHSICLEAEPTAGIFWSQYWREDREPHRWMHDRQPRSETFLPYQEYCEEHKCDLDECICEGCGTVGHQCNCKKCDTVVLPNVDPDSGYRVTHYQGCGKYHNREDEDDFSDPRLSREILPEMRCQCLDTCEICGQTPKKTCGCHKCSYCNLYSSTKTELPEEIRCKCYDPCPVCGKKREPATKKSGWKSPHSCSCHLSFETSDPEFNQLCYSLRNSLNLKKEIDTEDAHQFFEHLLYQGDFYHDSVRDLVWQLVFWSGPLGEPHYQRLYNAYARASEESPEFMQGYGSFRSSIHPVFEIPAGGGGLVPNNSIGAKPQEFLELHASLWIPVYMQDSNDNYRSVDDERALEEIGQWLVNWLNQDPFMRLGGQWELRDVGDSYDKDAKGTISISHPGGGGEIGEMFIHWFLGLPRKN